MKLKSLEISGFKSFADKTVINILPGMTGIVGPNGSGKSNIIEAMRWVMGEQSAKDLRGSKMSDVIFGGTNNRGPLNRAEVSMTFDNTDHYIKSDFNEIRISRKLYRSGESSYQINGIETRLRDIHDLFMDTGLGRESFSIISQGRVESIFNAKPENRRAIIEEVAGVHKYKQNKERAQKELAQTHDNLTRITDIIREIESRIEPLAEQSAKATDYLAQQERFEHLDKIRLGLTQYELESKIDKVRSQIALQDEIVNRDKTKLDQLNTYLVSQRQENNNAQMLKDELQQSILSATRKREQLIGSKNLSLQEIGTLSQDINNSKQQISRLSEQLTNINEQINTLEVEKKQLLDSQKSLELKVDVFKESDNGQLKARLEKQLEQSRSDYIQIMQEIATLRNTMQTDEENQIVITNHINDLSQRLNQAKNDLRDVESHLTIDESESDQQKLANLEKTIENKQRNLEQLTADFHKKEKSWYQLLSDLNKLRSKRDALNAMDEYAGFYQGVRALMKPEVRQIYPGIRGVVGELVVVDQAYTLAIETSLGAALQHIVVDSTETAKQVIHYLTKKRAGRVTILPLDTIKARQITGHNQIKSMTGFIGIAAELVSMPKDMATIKANLLGTTVIVDNLTNAIQIAKSMLHRYRVVTLDGQIINAGGSMTGGSQQKKQTNGILGRQAELTELNQSVKKLHLQTQESESSLQKQRQYIDQLKLEIESIEKNHIKAKNQSNKIDYLYHKKQDELIQKKRNLATLEYDFNEKKLQKQELDDKIEDEKQRIRLVETKKDNQENEVKRISAELSQLTEKNQANNNEKVAVEAKYAAIKTKINSVIEKVVLLDTQKDDIQTRLDDVKLNLSTYENRMSSAENTLAMTDQLEQIEQELKNDQQNLDKQTNQLVELGQALETLQEQFVVQQTNLKESTAVQSQNIAKLTRLETQFDSLKAQILMQYDAIDVSDIIAEHELTEIDDINSQLSLVKRSLDEIGHVNMNAINEYEEVQSRFDFLNSQRNDLQLSRETLLTTIDEMDQEVQLRFKQTFDEVAKHFSTVFSKMFGGGQAEICLTDPKHLLTTGIDIIAQPPGKKFQQMSLLSGGEKALTAITLLFAILKVRPVPFVVLDEAEAALDEANVDRFANYLFDFAGETQFIVITHRKGTMLKANLLYGVTMQEAGVSKMIAVDLEKATESVG
ncbi:chromosome segregation protein SMC [Leuconostoc palmae]|uniref:chromosome segregation protein SMC n=1 Tax=Leuconostoc palmae TaxID=501487 RepID=UPI001C7D77B5|nr:chromosome segregation protein SMC [Leuconostoc palmae]